MTMKNAVFVVPGDITTKTGGYIYDQRLLEGLRNQGRQVQHIALGSTFPHPSDADALDASRQLLGLPEGSPVIIDGLALGAIDNSVIAALKPPLVALIHHPLAYEGGLDKERRKFLFETERANLALVSSVIVPSNHIAELLVRDYEVPASRITVVPPGIDIRPRVRKTASPPLILSVGIQVRRKGHDLLLRALAQISDLPWQAVIVGAARDAEYAQELLELRAELGLETRVRLAGQVFEQELIELYSQASIFALASRFEGYGMVLAEAMSFGLPIISSRVGAVVETVPEAAGILIEPEDPNKLSKAVRKLLLDPALMTSMGQASLEAGSRLTNWASVSNAVGRLLDEAFESKHFR